MPEPVATDTFPLGRAPRPTTGEDLAERVRRTVADQTGNQVDVSALQVRATLDGPEVPSLEIDLTGIVVAGARKAPPAPAPITVREREPGVVHRLSVDAHPVTVEGVRVDVRAEAEQVRFSWVEGTDGSLAVELVEPTADAPLLGTLRIAAARTELVAAIRRLAEQAAASQGLKLTQLDVDLTSKGPRAVSVAARAQLRKGFLSATATGGANATIDDALVLTLSDVTATSGNPIVAAVLATARGRLQALEGRRIDLGAQLPPGVRIVDLRLDVGPEVVLTARTA
ncbi:hypothetical protein [Cellulomonas rhizosphaerae]|uniref:Uncharacterized protein n=1 Tax=Cellulomonas rhizosphaerae TaxID=2293719 RepID=A0A413RRC1_9CELL|nr:hypothetical protein [Cellulomonas rhizosphaerae]RHA44549.1 hypothetical protein D1825_00645 [Cellulomonas rhizosphaerae]